MLQLAERLLRTLCRGFSAFILGWWQVRRTGNVVVLARGVLCVLLQLCILLEVLFDPHVGAERVPPGRSGGFLQGIAKPGQNRGYF